LLADLPGGFGGTSGAPVATDRGVIAMVLSEAGAAIVKMRSIEQIQQAIANRSDLAWSVTDSRNLPPSSPEDVQFELTDALNSYVFALQDIRDALNDEYYTEKDLASRVAHVERSIESTLSAQALGPVRRQRRPALRAASGIWHRFLFSHV